MRRHDDALVDPLGAQRMPALGRHARRPAENGAASCRPEAHDDVGLHRSHLGVEPGAARHDVADSGLLVDAAHAAPLEPEVLDRVRDVRLLTRDSGLLEGTVKQLARWPDERLAGKVLLVARLLADEHESRLSRSGREHRLRRIPPQLAPSALGRGRSQPAQVDGMRNPLLGSRALRISHTATVGPAASDVDALTVAQLSSRSGRTRRVRSTCCSCRHWAIAPWLPLSRMGGTSRPRQLAGFV